LIIKLLELLSVKLEKNPSSEQAKKIEGAIHKLANELQAVSIYAE